MVLGASSLFVTSLLGFLRVFRPLDSFSLCRAKKLLSFISQNHILVSLFITLSLSLYNRLFYLSLPNDDLFDDDDDKEEEVKKKIYKKCPHPLPLMRL